MDAKKPDWFVLTESDGAPRPARKTRSKAPMSAFLAGVVLLGGSVIASAQDDEGVQSTSIAATGKVDSPENAAVVDVPTDGLAGITPIANLAPRPGGYDDDDEDEDEDEEEDDD